MPSEKVSTKRAQTIKALLNKIFDEIKLKGIDNWEQLRLLGKNNLKSLSQILDPEKIQKDIKDLRDSETQILLDLLKETTINDDLVSFEKMSRILNLNELHKKTVLRRPELEFRYKIATLHENEVIEPAIYIPRLRDRNYLNVFRGKAAVYLPSVYKEEELKNIPERWGLAHVDIEDDIYSEEDVIYYAFEFDVLKDGSYCGEKNFNQEADLHGAEIFSYSEFLVLTAAALNNTPFFQIWEQNLNLPAEIDREKYLKSLKDGLITIQ